MCSFWHGRRVFGPMLGRRACPDCNQRPHAPVQPNATQPNSTQLNMPRNSTQLNSTQLTNSALIARLTADQLSGSPVLMQNIRSDAKTTQPQTQTQCLITNPRGRGSRTFIRTRLRFGLYFRGAVHSAKPDLGAVLFAYWPSPSCFVFAI